MTKAEKTKQFIIETVAPIFNKKGVYGTSMNDITQATGLTKGAIYGNFKDKDDLANTCYDQNLIFLQKGFYRSFTGAHSNWEKLEELLLFYRSNFTELSAAGGCPLMNTAIEADDGYTLLQDRVRQTFEAWEKELEAIISEGQESGEFNAHSDASTLSKLFIATVEGAILLSKTTNNTETFGQVIDKFSLILEKELKL